MRIVSERPPSFEHRGKVSENATTMLAGPEPGQTLSWENLGKGTPWRAFRESLRELLLHPLCFFERMATEGGLREPLTFFWILAAAAVLLSFPLTLAYFGLTAPDPAGVSPATYNLHLLAPRVAGFAVVLLPVVLLAGALALVLTGTIFHLAARLFGARNWEGSISIWCYAKSAGAFPVVAAEMILCVLTIGCYLGSVAFPGTEQAAARVARLSIWILGPAAGAASAALFFTCLIAGCIRAFDLDPASGIAAGLAGVLLTLGVGVGPMFGWLHWGPPGVAVTLGGELLLMLALAVIGKLLPVPGPGPGEVKAW